MGGADGVCPQSQCFRANMNREGGVQILLRHSCRPHHVSEPPPLLGIALLLDVINTKNSCLPLNDRSCCQRWFLEVSLIFTGLQVL